MYELYNAPIITYGCVKNVVIIRQKGCVNVFELFFYVYLYIYLQNIYEILLYSWDTILFKQKQHIYLN